MNLRVARHTKDLNKIIKFYHNLLELEVLGSFQNHKNYNGVFLGILYDESQLNRIKSKFIQNNIKQTEAKNSYWNENGFLFLDPDDFGIILTLNQKLEIHK